MDTELAKYADTIGNGVDRDLVVNHRLGTQQVVVQLWDAATGEDLMSRVMLGVPTRDDVVVTFPTEPNPMGVRGFAQPPAVGAVRVVVVA